ncbi:MAG: 3-oxoacyl-ACP reductase FabG [Ottowia sp.]|nr:3-oxoacyl-ACP reductase FabG [Ottowia sp.]
MPSLENKIALVTGASRGIGRAIAAALARAGATVIGTATSESGAQKIHAELTAIGPAHQGMVLDVNDVSACEHMFEHILQTHHGLHILVNNAGITRDQLALRMKDEDWSAVINTNLTSVFRLSRAALKPMIKAREGRIINITSVVGHTGNPGQANYAAAKAGVTGMSHALAQEIGTRNITVNCIAPGFIATDMTDALSDSQHAALQTQIPLRRLGQPEDIAHAAVFLASSEASYITGTTLHVNGGLWMN